MNIVSHYSRLVLILAWKTLKTTNNEYLIYGFYHLSNCTYCVLFGSSVHYGKRKVLEIKETWSSDSVFLFYLICISLLKPGDDNRTFKMWNNLKWMAIHDDVIKWKHFPRYWPFVQGIRQSLVNSLHKGQWRGALMISLICVCINGWVNNREAADLRCYRAHYDVSVMWNGWPW